MNTKFRLALIVTFIAVAIIAFDSKADTEILSGVYFNKILEDHEQNPNIPDYFVDGLVGMAGTQQGGAYFIIEANVQINFSSDSSNGGWLIVYDTVSDVWINIA